MAGEALSNCEAFSSRVMRESRSSTRFSTGWLGSLYVCAASGRHAVTAVKRNDNRAVVIVPMMPHIGYTGAEMKQIFLTSIMAVLLNAAQPFAGRWDLTVTTPKDTYPSWMEFTESGGQPQVRVVGRVASVHPATDVKLDGAHLSFTTSEWFDGQIKVTWEFHAAGGKITGTQKRADGVEGQIA